MAKTHVNGFLVDANTIDYSVVDQDLLHHLERHELGEILMGVAKICNDVCNDVEDDTSVHPRYTRIRETFHKVLSATLESLDALEGGAIVEHARREELRALDRCMAL